MNDGWKKKDGARWNRREKDAVTRRFRHHVRTPHNPKGRIHREPCHFHPHVTGEAHHVDYARPFLVVWLGAECGCHRRVDHGAVKVTKAMLWDYSSLVIQRKGVKRDPGGPEFFKPDDVPF